MTGLPYHDTATLYVEAGWDAPLPISAKSPIVSGHTGHDGATPTPDEIQLWKGRYADANIGLRLPPDAVGIDRDTHKVPDGDRLWEAMEAALGPLPVWWRSTSRDGPSGKTIYRVPPGTVFGGDIVWEGVKLGEFIQHHHRHVNVWPSVNPHNANRVERWVRPDGTIAEGEVPLFRDRPDLPQVWIDHFRAPGTDRPAKNGPRPVSRAVERLARPDLLHPHLVKLLDQVAPDPRPSWWTWRHIVAIVTTCRQLGLGRYRVKAILQSDEHALRHAEGHFDHKADYWYGYICKHHPQEHVGRLCSAATGCKLDSGWLEEDVALAGEHLRDLVVPALDRKGEVSLRDLQRGPFHRFARKDPYRASAEWVERVIALGAESGIVDRCGLAVGGEGGRPSTRIRLCDKTPDEASDTPSDLRFREAPGLQEQYLAEVALVVPPNAARRERSTSTELIVNAAPKSFQNGQGLCDKTPECLNVRCDEAGVVQSPVTGCWLCQRHASDFGYARRILDSRQIERNQRA